MDKLETVVGNYHEFLDDILLRVVNEGFDLDDFSQLDHMCYRTSSNEAYADMKQQLSGIAHLLGETIVSGRPISTFRLHEPVQHNAWRIDAIELPAPKPHSPHADGLEHVEFVIFDDIETFLAKYPDKPFNLDAAQRGTNPEIGLKLGEYSVKFHLLSLPTVLYLEHKLGIDVVS